MKTRPFLNTAFFIVLSVSLFSCSPKNATTPTSTNTPTVPTVSQTGVTATPIPTSMLKSTPSSQAAATASLAPATLEFVKKISGDSTPLSIPANLALDTKGYLYVLDGGAERVQVFDPSGKFISMWGSQGAGDGQFNLLVHEDSTYTIGGIVLDKNNNVYIGDGLNSRIQEFDSRGNFLTKWGSYGANDGQFLRVLDLAIDAQGDIYVVDDHSDDIQKFDPKGKFIIRFGEEGRGDGQLNNTGGITIGPDGNLYIADYGNNRVEVFSANGKYLRQWPTPVEKVVDIAIDPKGNIFTTHEIGDIVEYDPNGSPISVMSKLGLDGPGGIVISPNNLIYVTDNNGVEVLQEK